MLGILADHHEFAMTTDNLALVAYLFNGRLNFHLNYHSFLLLYAM